MIYLNLLPPEKRKKRRVASTDSPLISREMIIALIGGFVVILVCVHIILQVFVWAGCVKLSGYQKTWSGMGENKTKVSTVEQKISDRQDRISSLGKVTRDLGFSWARKLNGLSDAIPRGVWLRKISLSDSLLGIYGSAVSKHKAEMMSPHTMLSNLHADEKFMKGFSAVDIESIKGRLVNGTSVADFIVRAEVEVFKESQDESKKPTSRKRKEKKKK